MARVLVVDDAAFMRKMVSDALTKGGHEVVGEAGNGRRRSLASRSSSPSSRRSTSRCPRRTASPPSRRSSRSTRPRA